MCRPWVACTLLVATAASGQEPATRLNLRTTLTRALENDPDLGPARARVLAADADLARAHAGYFPSGWLIDAFGLAPGAQLGVVPDGLPPELAPLFSPSSQFDFSNIVGFNRLEVQVHQPIYTFGKISTGVEAAEWGRMARKADLARMRENAILEVKRLFWGHKLARESLDLTRELTRSLEEALEKAEERVKAGKEGVTQQDVLKLRVAVAASRRGLARAERGVGLSLAGFRRVLGYLPDDPVFPDEEKLAPVEVPEELRAPTDLAELTRARPAWQAVEAGVHAQEKRVRVEKLKYLPDFYAAGLFTWAVAPGRADINNPFLLDQFNYLVGGAYLGVHVDLDPWGTSARVASEEARLAELEALRNEARLGLPVETMRAWMNFEAAKRTLEVSRDGRKAARALAMTTLANFGLGIGDADKVLESVGFYGKEDAAWLESIYGYNVAVAELGKVLGRELDPSLAEPER